MKKNISLKGLIEKIQKSFKNIKSKRIKKTIPTPTVIAKTQEPRPLSKIKDIKININIIKYLLALFSVIIILSFLWSSSYIQKQQPLKLQKEKLELDTAALEQKRDTLLSVIRSEAKEAPLPIQDVYEQLCKSILLISSTIDTQAKVGVPTFTDLVTLQAYISPAPDMKGIKKIDISLIVLGNQQSFFYILHKMQTHFPILLHNIRYYEKPEAGYQGSFHASLTLYGL